MTLAAGFVLQFLNGSTFAVGSIVMYIYSYFPVASFSETQEIFPIMMVVSPFCNFIGATLLRSGFSTYLLIPFGATVMIGGLYLSSFVQTFNLFVPLFAISFGFGGFFFSLILAQGWQYFPGYEGVVSGTIIAGFGIGGFFTNMLAVMWINPDGTDPVPYNKNDPSSKPFTMDLASNMPPTVRKLCIFFSFVALVSLLLLRNFKAVSENLKEPKGKGYMPINNSKLGSSLMNTQVTNGDSEQSFSRNNSVAQVLVEEYEMEGRDLNEEIRLAEIDKASLATLIRQPQFYVVYILNTLTIFFGTFIVGSNKTWGQQVIGKERFLNQIAGYATICAALRFFWSFLLDKYSFKIIFGFCIVI